jgi:RNA polymerase sigma factor for flagellar operon FliA
LSGQATVTEELWMDFLHTKDIEVRNNILLNYIHLVKYIVHRMAPSYQNYIDYDDLMSYGILGLMDAIDKYDMRKGVKFETYASLRIRGAIIDQIRKQDWVPRSVRKKVKDIEECYRQLEMELSRQPTDEEVADRLQISVEELRKVLDESYTYNFLSFEEVARNVSRRDSLLPKDFHSPEDRMAERELREVLIDTLESLSEKERLVITLYYFEELTLKEIGKVLEVSESRVSQIHSKALIKLKGKLQEYIS